jgi:hypothetical protein
MIFGIGTVLLSCSFVHSQTIVPYAPGGLSVSNARERGRHADFYRDLSGDGRTRGLGPSRPYECPIEFKCVLLDLERRQANAIPDDIRAAAAQLIGEES